MIAQVLSAMLPSRMSADYGPLSDFWYAPVGTPSTAGIVVKPDKALAVSAVYGCIRVLRESLGQLPFRVYKKVASRSKEIAPDNFLWSVLHDRPNSWQTPMEWKEMCVVHLCLRGNFYCHIVGSYDGMELIPLNPDRMSVKQKESGALEYKYRRPAGEPRTFGQEELLHVRGMSINGITGVSILEYARNSIGSSIAQETHGASLFKNGGLPSFWIKRPAGRKWTQRARFNFREGWRAVHAGPENAGNPPILEDDMELREIGMTNRDSQWIEARSFGAEEICRFFGVVPHMIGIKSTAPLGSSVEQQSLEYVIYTLNPLAVRIEQACNRDLVANPRTHYTKIVLDALLRGDMKSRYEAYNIGIQGGWIEPNEARILEDKNPLPGGDGLRQALNMQPAGGGPDENEQGGQPGKGTPKPPQKQATEDDDDTAYKKRKAAQQEVFGILLEEAAKRIAAHEVRGLSVRADKAAEDRDKWRQWGGEFYRQHHAYAEKVLDPICAAWLADTGIEHGPSCLASLLQEPQDISELFADDADVPQVLERWGNELANIHNQQLRERFFDEL